MTLIAILVLAFGLRFWNLGLREIEGDEAFTYHFSLQTPADIIRTTLAAAEPHPVGSYILEHYWLAAVGHTELALRFPSAWFGVIAVAVIYRLVHDLTRPRLPVAAPLLAALFVAVSPFLVEMSRNDRMYSLSLGLCAVSTWLAFRLAWQPPSSPGLRSPNPALWILPWIAYVVITWAALNVHYFSGMVVLAQNGFFAFAVLARARPERRLLLTRWITAQAVVGAAFLPWFLQVREILATYRGLGAGQLGVERIAELTMRILAVGPHARPEPNPFPAVGFALAVLGLITLATRGQRGRSAAILLALLVLVPVGAAAWDTRSRNSFTERQVIATSIGFFGLMGVGAGASLSRLSVRGRSPAAWSAKVRLASSPSSWWGRVREGGITLLGPSLAIVSLAGMALGTRAYFQEWLGTPPSWRPFVELVNRYAAGLPPDRVRLAQNFPDPGLGFYYRQQPPAISLPAAWRDAEGADAQVQGLVHAGIERVLVRLAPRTEWNGEPESNIAREALSKHYAHVFERSTGRWTLAIYGRAESDRLEGSRVTFENGVRLDGWVTRPIGELRANTSSQGLEVFADWAGSPSILTGEEKTYIHVLDEQGRLVAQLDEPLRASDLLGSPRAYGVPLPDDVRQGEYRVRLGLYDPARPGAPRLLTDSGADGVDVGAITIRP